MDAMHTPGPGDTPCSHRPGRSVTVALQGGGAHGAFAWGVLDRLLDEPDLHIATISGVSAGAMNAAMLAQGLATGGPRKAKHLLRAFWRRVAAAGGALDLDLAPYRLTHRPPFHVMACADHDGELPANGQLIRPGRYDNPDAADRYSDAVVGIRSTR